MDCDGNAKAMPRPAWPDAASAHAAKREERKLPDETHRASHLDQARRPSGWGRRVR